MKDLLIRIWVAINPEYWLMNDPFNKEWDEELKGLLDQPVLILNDFNAYFGDIGVWIANHPFASFSPLDNTLFKRPIPIRPSRVTIFKAGRIIRKHMKEHTKRELEARTKHIYS